MKGDSDQWDEVDDVALRLALLGVDLLPWQVAFLRQLLGNQPDTRPGDGGA